MTSKRKRSPKPACQRRHTEAESHLATFAYTLTVYTPGGAGQRTAPSDNSFSAKCSETNHARGGSHCPSTPGLKARAVIRQNVTPGQAYARSMVPLAQGSTARRNPLGQPRSARSAARDNSPGLCNAAQGQNHTSGSFPVTAAFQNHASSTMPNYEFCGRACRLL